MRVGRPGRAPAWVGVLEIAGTSAVMLGMAVYGRIHLRPGVPLDDVLRLVFLIGVFGWALVLEARLHALLGAWRRVRERPAPPSRHPPGPSDRFRAGRYRAGYAVLLSCWGVLIIGALVARA